MGRQHDRRLLRCESAVLGHPEAERELTVLAVQVLDHAQALQEHPPHHLLQLAQLPSEGVHYVAGRLKGTQGGGVKQE